jgi:hypothetical protein
MATDGHLFGGGIADFVVTAETSGTLLLAADTEVWFYNEQTGGTRYEDGLTDLSDNAITAVTSDETGAIPQLRGPAGITTLWADANGGAGPRRQMDAHDLGDDLAGLSGRVTTVEAYTVLGRQVTVYRDATSGAWPARPDTTLPVHWWETIPTAPSPPTIGEPYALDGVDFYHGRAGA